MDSEKVKEDLRILCYWPCWDTSDFIRSMIYSAVHTVPCRILMCYIDRDNQYFLKQSRNLVIKHWIHRLWKKFFQFTLFPGCECMFLFCFAIHGFSVHFLPRMPVFLLWVLKYQLIVKNLKQRLESDTRYWLFARRRQINIEVFEFTRPSKLHWWKILKNFFPNTFVLGVQHSPCLLNKTDEYSSKSSIKITSLQMMRLWGDGVWPYPLKPILGGFS